MNFNAVKRGIIGVMMIPAVALSQVSVDPTRPATASASGAGSAGVGLLDDGFPAIQIQAIYASSVSRRVVINGRGYYEGDQIDGMKLVTIQSHAITLIDPSDNRSKTYEVAKPPKIVEMPNDE